MLFTGWKVCTEKNGAPGLDHMDQGHIGKVCKGLKTEDTVFLSMDGQ